MLIRSILSALLLTLLGSSAHAHFLWVGVGEQDGKSQTCVWFSEGPSPGEAHLVDKVAHTKVWGLPASGSEQVLGLTKQVSGDEGGFVIAAGSANMIEAMCDYGVITRGDDTFLLQYYAKHIGSSAADPPASTASKNLVLDVPARRDGDSLTAQVLFNGKPASDAKVTLILPDGEELDVKLDDQAKFRTKIEQSGQYGLRAAFTQTPLHGERDGKTYAMVKHYSTVTIDLATANAAASATASAASSSKTMSAADLLADARATRAVWVDFKGFRAQARVRIDGQEETAIVEVDENGVASTKLKNSQLQEWTENQLASLVQHRMPSDDRDENVTYTEETAEHPLGRSINLGDKEHQSVYRIKDRVVTEVNRQAGPMRFTISVLENEWNAEGKYLPRVVSLSNWVQATGELKSSTAVTNSWQRIGSYDIPKTILEVTTGKDQRQVRQLDLSELELLK